MLFFYRCMATQIWVPVHLLRAVPSRCPLNLREPKALSVMALALHRHRQAPTRHTIPLPVSCRLTPRAWMLPSNRVQEDRRPRHCFRRRRHHFLPAAKLQRLETSFGRHETLVSETWTKNDLEDEERKIPLNFPTKITD